MWTILSTVFVASVAGSLHCVGMCGPFALMCATRDKGSLRTALGSVAWFNGGRLVMYVCAGCVAGALGMAIDFGGSLAGVQRSAAWCAGGLMIAAGILKLMPSRWKRAGGLPRWNLLQPAQRWLRRSQTWAPPLRAAIWGALTSLMPCGWLYVFVIAAAGTGHPLSGGLVMGAFWIGTLPALGGLMLGAAPLGPQVVARIPTVMAVLMIGLGLYTVAGRGAVELRADALPLRGQIGVGDLNEIDARELPCCHGGEQ